MTEGMYRLLGPHVNAVQGGLPEVVAQWKPPVALVMDHQPAWHWVKEVSPKTKIVGRLFVHPQPDFNDAGLDPRTAARQHCDAVLPVAGRMAGVYTFWQGVNEPVIGSREAMQRYATFEVERIKLLAQHGFRAAVGSFAVGNPGDMSFWRDFLPALEAAKAHNGVLSLHQYGWPTMQDGADWLSLRHRKVYQGEPSHGWEGLPQHLRLPLIITETGLDGGIQTPGWKQGWNGHTEGHMYRQQLQWYDEELRKNKYVLGAAIFCSGNLSPDWVSFDIWQDVMKAIGEHADPLYRQAQVIAPEPGQQAMGPDVSYWQGTGINWREAAEGGVTFAYLRTSYRVKTDSTYPRNHEETGKHGILRGGYHYLYPEQPAEDQARVFAATLLDSELPPMLDVEQAGLNEAFVRAFLDEFENQTGVKAGIYTSASKWHELIGTGANWAAQHPLWVAYWRDEPAPALPQPWTQWEFWQFTNQGQIDGYSARVDMNRFDGTVAEFKDKYGS